MLLRALFVLLLSSILGGCASRRGGEWEPIPTQTQATVRPQRDREVLAGDRVSASGSLTVAGPLTGAPLLGLLGAALVLIAVQRRRARAERAVEARGPLANGVQEVAGVVEAEDGTPGAPVVVYVHQRGTEIHGKGGYSHTWSETGRDVVARPFHLRRDDGGVIRVEPDGRVELRAQLAVGQRHAVDARTRVAEVRPGTRVLVTGELMRGNRPGARVVDPVYRDAPSAAVLVPPRGGRLVISTEPPGETAARRARFHTRWAAALTLALTLLGGVAARDYLVLLFDGTQVQGAPVAYQRWEEWVKPKNRTGYWVPHFGVLARASVAGADVTVEDECATSLYYALRTGDCARLPFVVSQRFPAIHQLGRRPHLTSALVALLLIASLTFVIAYPAATLGTRPWYARRCIRNTGNGRLDAS